MKKKEALKKASTKNKNIKPVKAFTGLEIALLTGVGSMFANQALSDKPKATAYADPFKKYDPSMTPEQYVAKSTSAPSVTNTALNPVTSSGQSASTSTGTGTTDNGTIKNVSDNLLVGLNNREETPTTGMKDGGSVVRGMGSAIRGFKKSRVL